MYDTFFSGPSLSGEVERGKAQGYPVAHTLSAADLWNEFARDDKAAGVKYADQFLQVSGKVRTVDARKGSLLLDTASSAHGIECNFPSRDDVAGIKAGDAVTLQGEGSSRARPDANVVLATCILRK